jgi:hypothetical protein
MSPYRASLEDDLPGRLSRVITAWLLLLATAWVAEPYVVALWSATAGPRTVTARGDLSEAEQATIKLFQTASPSVLHVFARSLPFPEGGGTRKLPFAKQPHAK